MTVAVSDASPLIALDAIGQVDLLLALNARIVIPAAVEAEIARTVTLPDWIEIQAVSGPTPVGLAGRNLGAGETEAITLALEIAANYVIADDAAARRAAKDIGVKVVGTLGVVLAAKDTGAIDAVRPVIDALIATGLHISSTVYNHALGLARETAV